MIFTSTKVCNCIILYNFMMHEKFGGTYITMAKRKRTNNYLQNITLKTKERSTRTPIKTRSELLCCGMVSSSCLTCDTRRVTVKRHEHHLIWKSCSVYHLQT